MFKFLQILVPQDKKFFPLFENASRNLYDTSKKLCQLVNSNGSDNHEALIKEIEHLEHVGDNITHEILNELSTTFITPFDREDIHELTSALDNVVDNINGTAKRMLLYKIKTFTPAIIELAKNIENSAFQINIAIKELANLKKPKKIKEACVIINSNENLADIIFDDAIANLFEEETNAIEIIKLKEIYSALETATDDCEDVANVIESILLKNA